jgi:hypothetical protein
MKLRETIKSKVDQLEASGLRVVNILIDSLNEPKKREMKETFADRLAYLKVKKLVGPNFLSSVDMSNERQERI